MQHHCDETALVSISKRIKIAHEEMLKVEYQADAGLGVHTAAWMDLKHMVLNGNLRNKVRSIICSAIDWITVKPAFTLFLLGQNTLPPC